MVKEEKSNVMRLKSVGVMSLAKVMAILGIIGGFITGILWVFASKTPNATAPGSAIAILGWWSIIVLPFAYGLAYFLSGLIGGWLYNIVAGWIGGVELHLK